MSKLTMIAPCLFGLESILSGEIKRMGGEDVRAADGRVTFAGTAELLARANLGLRTAERVGIVLGEFEARSFTELFDRVAELPFEAFIGRKDAFPVKGWSLKSGLHSIPDCQSIIKKAAVRRLESAYGEGWFEESGPAHQIQFTILKDHVTILLDTSGQGLHKRGYRETSTEGPIKETLAAGIADLAQVRRQSRVLDPMCGSGTLLIESAMRALDIAPGLNRGFAAEQWDAIPARVWQDERDRARAAIKTDREFVAAGSDLDPEAVALTRHNAEKAGVGRCVQVSRQDLAQWEAGSEPAAILCNPPYGERLLEVQQAEELYRLMGRRFPKKPGFRCAVISPHDDFEGLFGRRANKRRKLYNGMIRCQLFLYD